MHIRFSDLSSAARVCALKFSTFFATFTDRVYNMNILPSTIGIVFAFLLACLRADAGMFYFNERPRRPIFPARLPCSRVSRRSFVSIARLPLIIAPRDGSIRIVAQGWRGAKRCFHGASYRCCKKFWAVQFEHSQSFSASRKLVVDCRPRYLS